MVGAPPAADERIARRLADVADRSGEAIASDVRELLGGHTGAGVIDGSVIRAAAADALVRRHELSSTRELALLALPVAREMASPPISGYRVAAAGIEAGSGDIVLGGNLEFPGTDLGSTIHAEGFVALRARRRGRALAVLAVSHARPCAHCRQTLAESAGVDELLLVDLLGNEIRLADIYPWAFRPDALGVGGDTATAAWPALGVDPDGLPEDAAAALVDAGRHAHAPYSGSPSSVALRLGDGRLVSAGCVESVAFNPTITAIQAALVEVAAAGATAGEITEGWLGRTAGGPVDPAPGFRATLAAVAPGAAATVVDWRPGP